jgi:PD-(D/E)XK nuclease superfamily
MTPEQAGIFHYSPSSLNKFIESPGLWARQYLGGDREASNARMWRGNAVEAGFAAALRGRLDFALTVADISFRHSVEENCVNATDTVAVKSQEALIEPMLKQCMEWSPPSKLYATQTKVEYWFPDVPVLVIGYADLSFEPCDKHVLGIDVDLKTTEKLYSLTKPRPDHVRQASLYRAARKKDGGILYVTDKKHLYFDVTDEMMGAALTQLNDAARKVTRLLAAFDKPEDIIEVLPIDWDHWKAPKANAPGTASASALFTAVET